VTQDTDPDGMDGAPKVYNIVPYRESGMTEDGIRTIRNFVIVTVLRVVGMVIALTALLGLFIPWLINAHNDLDLWLAIVLAIVTLVGSIAVGMQLIFDFRRFPAKFHKAEGHNPK